MLCERSDAGRVARPAALAVLLGAALAAAPCPGRAQTPGSVSGTVRGEQGLDFGRLTPGVAKRVSAMDAGARAELVLDGLPPGALRFVFPSELVSETGARLRVVFDQAVYAAQPGRLRPFDPANGAGVQVEPGASAGRVYVGATVHPRADQEAGRYTGTVMVYVTPTGG